MKKTLLYLFVLLSVQAIAQDNSIGATESVDKVKIAQTIDALKTAYITKELNLSPDEAQKFWPVYNGFTNDIKKAKVEFKQDDIAFEEKKVIIMKKYRDDFKKLLNNDDRVKRCFRAEPEFHKILKNEWQRRQSIHQQNRQQIGRIAPIDGAINHTEKKLQNQHQNGGNGRPSKH